MNISNPNKTRLRGLAGVLALAVLAGCAHRPAPVGSVYSQPDPYGVQAVHAGYDQPPVYSPRGGYGTVDRYGQPRYDGYPADQRSYPRRGYGDRYGDGYGRYGYGQQAGVEFGRVHHIQAMSGYQANSGGGALLGGVIGAIVGRQFGNSSQGKANGTFAGAVGGVLIGNEIERQNRENRGYGRDGLVVSIALDHGGLREFAVPSVGDLRIGDRVRIEGNRLMRM
jgi:outer membrane lipoprotein SlyB